MPPAKAKLIEPIPATFEKVMRVIVNAPNEVQEVKKELFVETSLEPWLAKIHCADAIEFMNKTLPAESVSCIVTSPPYNLKNSTGNGMKNGNGGKWPKAALMKGYEGHHDNMPHDKYVEWQR